MKSERNKNNPQFNRNMWITALRSVKVRIHGFPPYSPFKCRCLTKTSPAQTAGRCEIDRTQRISRISIERNTLRISQNL